ncbi:hypothetical protein C0989_004037 [Termitomyces sp. Mn162]|nr:hypothetical protein C0989_004037 [Termitomyces sp. Mn162]
MHIVFNPALSEINHVSIDDPPTLLNFTATLSVSDYQELKKDGGRVQLWSDIPYERAPAPYSEWTPCDFGLNATNLSSLQEISLSLVDHESSPGTAVLSLQLLVPLCDQRRFSYTYRILYPSGEIRWLGEFGQNGTLVCEYTATEITLGLAAGWIRKEGMYMWTDKNIRTDTPVLKLAKPDEYLALTVGSNNGQAILLFNFG